MRGCKLLFIAVIVVLAAGCDNLFKKDITFSGVINQGHYPRDAEGNVSTDSTIIDGPCANAKVEISDLNKVAITKSDGSYVINAKVNRKFLTANADAFTVKAFPPESVISPAEAENPAVVVYGRSGDTVQVPALLVLVSHNIITGGSITFKGQIYRGHHPTDPEGYPIKEILIIDGPCDGAIVQVIEFDETATCDALGKYSLTITTTKDYGVPALFTVQAFPPRYSGIITDSDGNDDYTTVYAQIGDTREVRPLVLVEYTDEDKNF